MTQTEIRALLRSQLTLASSKLAADMMNNLVSPLGLSVLCILWTLGRTRKTHIFNLIGRDWTTISHCISDLVERRYVHEEVISHKEKYLTLSTIGHEIYIQYICEAVRKGEALKGFMQQHSASSGSDNVSDAAQNASVNSLNTRQTANAT